MWRQIGRGMRGFSRPRRCPGQARCDLDGDRRGGRCDPDSDLDLDPAPATRFQDQLGLRSVPRSDRRRVSAVAWRGTGWSFSECCLSRGFAGSVIGRVGFVAASRWSAQRIDAGSVAATVDRAVASTGGRTRVSSVGSSDRLRSGSGRSRGGVDPSADVAAGSGSVLGCRTQNRATGAVTQRFTPPAYLGVWFGSDFGVQERLRALTFAV